MGSNAGDRADAVLLGIDAGLSTLKVALFDRRGALLGNASRGYETRTPAPGLSEQDPDQWIGLAAAATREAMAAAGVTTERVAGIGVSARGSSGIFIDAAGQVLGPHWLDGRHHAQHAALVERFGPRADTRSLPSRTRYLAEQHPDLFNRLAHPLFARDFLLFRLSGVVATDPSSGPDGHVWPAEVWEWVGLPAGQAPPVRAHTEIAGTLLPKVAVQFGLRPGTPVGLGGHDGACANTGAGAILPGQVCLTMGTNGVARSIASRPAPTVPWQGISAYHFLPGRWCCGGDAALLGHTPTWLAGMLEQDHASLETAARAVAPGCDGVTFLPFLAGQVSPEARPQRRGAWLGLHNAVGRAHLYRATLEGTACLIRQIADRLYSLGLGADDWRVSGGGGRSRLWMQIVAAMIERPLFICEPEEGPRGACIFVAVGLGWYPDVETCVAAWVRQTARIDPDPALVEAYRPLRERFGRLEAAVALAEAPTA